MSRAKYFLLWLGCWAVSIVLYSRGTGGHFLFDFNMWALRYQAMGWAGLPHSFGDNSMHHAGHIIPFILFRCLGYHAIGWTLVLNAIHSINAVLLFITVSKLLSFYSIHRNTSIAMVTGLFFLFSPLHTEVVVWASAVWYQVSLGLIWLSILLYIKCLRAGWGYLPLYYACIIVAYFTWEISFCIPFMALLLFLILPAPTAHQWRHFIYLVLLPFLFIFFYVLLNKIRADEWVSHYGAAHHLRFSAVLIVNNTLNYLLKLSAVTALLTYTQRDALLRFLSNPTICHILFFVALLLGAVLLRLRGNDQFKASRLFFLLTLSALVPVITIYQVYAKDIEQDRYLYVASPFLYAALVCIIYALLPIVGRYIVIVSYAGLLLFFQQRFVQDWNTAGRVQMGLLDSFKWANAKRIIIIASADNVNGAYCMRSQPYSSFAEALKAQRGIDITGKVVELVQFNLHSLADSMRVERLDSTHIKCTFSQWGNWYWKNGYCQSGTFEHEDYSVAIDEWNHSFIATIKQPRDGDKYIYEVGDRWVEAY